ncbi:MAG: type III secretion system chaperone [Gemmataceae bacterium]
MKKLMTAAFLMALTLNNAAFGEDDVRKGPVNVKPEVVTPKPEVVKATGKAVTLPELESMLIGLGYEPKPVLNKDGKLIGYDITIRSGDWDVYARIDISPNGKNIWISWTLKVKVDGTVPTEAVLAMLEQNYNIFPAYITYFPKSKSLWLGYRLLNTDVTPASLRAALEDYADAVKRSLVTWDKAEAIAKAKAKEKAEEGKGEKEDKDVPVLPKP